MRREQGMKLEMKWGTEKRMEWVMAREIEREMEYIMSAFFNF